MTLSGSCVPPTVAFVYPNPRQALAGEVAAGRAPDTTLLGQNHLAQLGLEARIHDPALTPAGSPRVYRVLWSLREVKLPWELGGADVAFTPLAAMFPLAARIRRSPRVVVLNYGLCTIWDRSTRARRRLLAASLRSASAVVCVGAWQRDRLLDQTGLAPERVFTAGYPVDERYFVPTSTSEGDRPLVLAVGKDLARDYATLGRAVAGLGVRTEIVAHPRNLEGVRLPSSAHARVNLSWAELRELYAEAACVVVPQRRQDYRYGSEGGGLTALLEAMAMARPVVATDRPVLHDYIEEEKTALVVPPEEPESLQAGIARILDDPALGSSLGSAARSRVEQGLTTRHFARAIAPILRAAGDQRRKAAQI
jgi:glycosyltransferase involved in cell wall biosynthesis